MADLFVALGYEQPRLNIHKSGRELDLSADHRFESRRAIAECKATADTIGGGDLNKFVGALDAENADGPTISGYFISLTGFKETAIEQERNRRTRIITLTGPQVVQELVRGRILISRDRATEVAGRCRAGLPHLVLDPDVELFAHERGWIWAVYYTEGKARTHFILIHADGTPLARTVAEVVIIADRACEGRLNALTCLNPAPRPGSDTESDIADALSAYGRYIGEECGFIQLDGLPADSDTGSRRLRLENLFVPLNLDLTPRGADGGRDRLPVGVVLCEHPRLALLAAPGGGKSTLVKRLATAYADPARRQQIDDELPRRDWLPLLFRCRELRELARSSFAELLQALSEREPVRQHGGAFRGCVDRALLAGQVLLLVDGLDEISDPGDRAAFVCTIRTALLAYPGTALVVTSREAGFRHVAAHLSAVCTHATLSAFDSRDISRLSIAWHREIVGDSDKVRTDAEKLAATIVQNDRIRRLAVNPLLLTTLLLVKRWVGTLPTRRTVLYGKGIEVLLMTWNTEGHDPISEEEALPQLCYVASAMMLDGVQTISRPRLAELLQEARNALPTELGYVQDTVEGFIHRVEDRSSLLMMTGLDVANGRLVEFFEFRHLTFQEFLAARAMVEGWHPGRMDNDTLVSVLEPHLEDEKWREVIPLAAVLGGKATEALIRRLTELVKALPIGGPIRADSLRIIALGNCLADEAAARPETIHAALEELVRFGSALPYTPFTSALARGRYGPDLRRKAQDAFVTTVANLANCGDALTQAVWWQIVDDAEVVDYSKATVQFVELLKRSDKISRCEGATGCGKLFYELLAPEHADDRARCAELLEGVQAILIEMLFGDSVAEQAAACYAIRFLGRVVGIPPPAEPDVLGRLFSFWRRSDIQTMREMGASAIASQPLAPNDGHARCSSIQQAELESLVQRYNELHSVAEKVATLVVGWYQRTPWSGAELARHAHELLGNVPKHDANATIPTLNELLEHLGPQPLAVNEV